MKGLIQKTHKPIVQSVIVISNYYVLCIIGCETYVYGMCVCMATCVWVLIYICMCTCGGPRSMSGILLDFYLLYLLDFLLLNLELGNSGQANYPPCHRDPPSLPSKCWDYKQLPCVCAFCMDPWNQKSSLHTCRTNNLLSHLSSPCEAFLHNQQCTRCLYSSITISDI